MFLRPIFRSVPELKKLRREVDMRLAAEVTMLCIAGHMESAFISELIGIHTIAVDDFGTGDAPFFHRQNFNCSMAKVDRLIINSIGSDSYLQRFLQ
jgi:EAL domain-containing protein (putative c-di-GMP-specific phosphodiesterase class I)